MLVKKAILQSSIVDHRHGLWMSLSNLHCCGVQFSDKNTMLSVGHPMTPVRPFSSPRSFYIVPPRCHPRSLPYPWVGPQCLMHEKTPTVLLLERPGKNNGNALLGIRQDQEDWDRSDVREEDRSLRSRTCWETKRNGRSGKHLCGKSYSRSRRACK